MKFISYGGETLALILAQPNWSVSPRVTDTLPFTSIEKANTGREGRQNFGRSNRYLLDYTPRFSGAAAATEFRIGLNRLAEETLAVPLWTDSVVLSSPVAPGNLTLYKTSVMPARYGSEWIILDSASGAYEIVVVDSINDSQITIHGAGTALAWSSGTLIYPLLFGRFEPRPSLESVTPQTVTTGLQIRENSSFARRINPLGGATRLVGANIAAFSTTPLLDIEPVWIQMLDTAEIEIAYEQLGFLRQDQSYTAQQTVRRGLELEFVCDTREKIAKVERFFSNQRGPVKPFFIPTWRADLIPTVNFPRANPNENKIAIAASEYSDPDRPPHPGDAYVAFLDPSSPLGNGVVDPHKITNVAGATLTTAVNITATHLAATTRLSFLLLARFAEPQIAWDYSKPQRARCRIKFLEVADEYVTPNTEAEPAFLYKFTEILPTLLPHFFTSYENPIEWDGDTWTPAPFSHGSIKTGAKLDREEVEITSWGGNFPTNPLAKFFPYTLEGDLFLDIVRVNAANPSDASAEILFAGIVTKPDFTGKNWKATARWLGNLLDRNVPRFFFQKTCNVALYSAKCGVNPADYQVTGPIAVVDDVTIDITTADDHEADYFSGGYCQTTDLASADFERRGILHSEPIAGGQRLVIDRPFRVAGVGTALDFFPGCNYSLEMCNGRFNNGGRFRGFPFIPIKNPSANLGEVQTASGGKKG
jgi:uncharacterized phage protein (TIGR02218 family)